MHRSKKKTPKDKLTNFNMYMFFFEWQQSYSNHIAAPFVFSREMAHSDVLTCCKEPQSTEPS